MYHFTCFGTFSFIQSTGDIATTVNTVAEDPEISIHRQSASPGHREIETTRLMICLNLSLHSEMTNEYYNI